MLERSMCCCMTFKNVQPKLNALNRCEEKQDQIQSIHDLSHNTLCAFEHGFPARECVDRTCTHCGTDAISSWYEPRLDNEQQVDHDQWKSVEEVKPIKTKGKKE